MLNRSILLLLLLVGASTAAQQAPPQSSAKTECPWLIQGTAAHALGGDVSVAVKMSDALEGTCRFSMEAVSPDYLVILVSKAALPTCPERSTELNGIGNEATRCNAPGSHGHGAQMISSRVRDLYFTVTLVSRALKGGGKSADAQNDALEQIAEEVAGNLY